MYYLPRINSNRSGSVRSYKSITPQRKKLRMNECTRSTRSMDPLNSKGVEEEMAQRVKLRMNTRSRSME